MISFERRQLLIEQLRNKPGLRVSELASVLNVSQGTIRNDLNALENEGRLTRFHGGAVLTEQKVSQNATFTDRQREHSLEKATIGRCAAEIVADGDSVFLDASSTAYYLAHALESKLHLRVVTNGIDVARLLAQNLSNMVILTGGTLNHEGSSLTGLLSEQIVHNLHVQKAFVSASGFSIQRGLTEANLEEAHLKHKAIESANKVFTLLDSSKLGQEDLTSFARPDQICCLYTDAGITPEWCERLAQSGIELKICE